MRFAALCCLLIVTFVGPVERAFAGGLEYAGAGSQGLARGGAVAARADDPMVLYYNPAGLAELRGTQLLVSANLALMNACVDPIGYYGWGAYGGGRPSILRDPRTGEELMLNLGSSNAGAEGAYYFGKLDTVCMDSGVTPVPQFGITTRISEALGIGFGLMFPAAMPQGQWGGENGIIHTPEGLRPAATRYMMLNGSTIGLFPTLGLAYRLAKWLRLGASFEWGVISADLSQMSAVSAGTTPSADVVSHLRAVDWFVPAFNASIHLVPVDAIDVIAAFRWQDDLNAAGDIELTSGLFSPTNTPRTKSNRVLAVKQGFPWKARFGVRYANRLAPRATGSGAGEAHGAHGERVHDPLEDERWDVEFDAEYQANSRNRDQVTQFQPDGTIEFASLTNMISVARFPDVTRSYVTIPKRWMDQWSLRAGGTYNLFPGLFAISIGGHYENRGVDPSYMQIDNWPVSRYGVHFGVTLRIFGTIDLVAAYAHIFQETIVVGAPTNGEGTEISQAYTNADRNSDAIRAIDKRTGVAESRSMPPLPLEENPKPQKVDGTARVAQVVTQTPNGQPPWIINSGTYRSSIDVFSLGVNMHF